MKVQTTRLGDDWLMRIDAEHGIGVVGQVVLGDSLWLAVNRDREGGYDVRYLEIVDGEVVRDIGETCGVSPDLFVHDGAVWAVVCDPYGERDRELVAPVVERASDPKRFPPFHGAVVGVHEGVLWRHQPDPKGDRLLPFTLATGKRSKQIKLEPSYNMCFVERDGLNLLRITDVHTHVHVDSAGRPDRERVLRIDLRQELGARSPLRLSGNEPAMLVAAGNAIHHLRFDAEGTQRAAESLAESENGIWNLWPVAHTARGFATAFNGESISGWLYASDGVREMYTLAANGFVDARGNVLELPAAKWRTPKILASAQRYFAVCEASAARGRHGTMFVFGRNAA